MRKYLKCTRFKIIVGILFYTGIFTLFNRKNDDLYGDARIFSENSTVELKPECKCTTNDEIISIRREKSFIHINYGNGSSSIEKTIDLTRLTCDLYETLKRGPHQKIISYSLYGRNKLYYGLIKENAAIAEKLYPGWTIRVYHDSSIVKEIKCELECLSNVDFCHIDNIPSGASQTWSARRMHKMMWRWLPLGDPYVDMFISRDTDSLIHTREVDAVNDWLSGQVPFHLMRDHPWHTVEILGGMWGYAMYKNRQQATHLFKLIKRHHLSHHRIQAKGLDQQFLTRFIWPLIQHDVIMHDSYTCEKYPGSRPFPTQRKQDWCYVGCYTPCCHVRYWNWTECPIECRPMDHKDWIYC